VSASWPPPPPQPGPRRRVDYRWATAIVIGVIFILILVRQNRIHIHSYYVLFYAAVIPSVIVHEVTHGWIALMFGDDTAKRAGRLSFNPLVHVSIFGTLILPALLILSGNPVFGWAKPVPVNISRLRNSRNSSVVVSLAGPMTNIIMAVVFGLIFAAVVSSSTKFNVFAVDYYQAPGITAPLGDQYLFFLGFANVFLAIFNLLPIPPLDGASVVERVIPQRWLPEYLSIRPYTIFLPFILIFIYPGAFSDIFSPFVHLWGHLLGNGTAPGYFPLNI
jgi:Zn-dependent protease